MTRRDLQAECKKHGRPGRSPRPSTIPHPVQGLCPSAEIGHPESGAIWLDVNGERRQQGDLDQMIWKVPEIVAYLSRLFERCSLAISS